MNFTPTMHALAGAMLVAAASNAHASDPIKVFFLAGQSNMAGNGNIEVGVGGVAGAEGSLRYKADTDPSKYGHLVDINDNWATRSDVWVWSRVGDASGTITTDSTGDLGVTFGATATRFGPEVGIGKVLGDHYDEQVVLVKTAWGGKSLYEDFRPPSAGGTTGAHYTLMVDAMQEAMGDIQSRYSGQTIEIEGLLWLQGWNDRSTSTIIDNSTSPITRFNDLAVAEYEANLTALIADLRSELSTPDLKVVVGTTGMGSDALFAADNPPHFDQNNNTLARALVAAQMNVGAADPNVITVDTHPFWRDASVSPASEIEHWNRNGESYYLIGEAMGEAMITPVPEPSSLVLPAVGGLSFVFRRRRR